MVVPLTLQPVIDRETAPTSNAAGTATSVVVTGTTVSVEKPGLELTVLTPPGSFSCPWPPAALAKKFPAQVTELLGRPLITVVRSRLGSRTPLPAASVVSTSPGEPNSQQALAFELVIETLVTWVKSLLDDR